MCCCSSINIGRGRKIGGDKRNNEQAERGREQKERAWMGEMYNISKKKGSNTGRAKMCQAWQIILLYAFAAFLCYAFVFTPCQAKST
jgi:hypothetical protein